MPSEPRSLSSSSEFPDVVPISSGQLFRPLARAKMVILGFAIVGAVVGAAIRISLGTEYRASAALMVVNNQETGGAAAGLAGALLGATQTMAAGQTSPPLLVKFATFNSVLMKVAEARGPAPRTKRVIDQIASEGTLRDQGKWTDRVNKYLDVELDQRTGIVRLTVDYADSALARFMLDNVVSALGTAFREAARGQAAGQRTANEVRAQSAEEELRAAERRLASFLSSNRGIAQYSQTNVTRQGLERDVQIAQNLYMQAASDRETARSKELQQTPAVMVVDNVPRQLPRVPRRLWFWMAVGMIIGATITVPFILWRARSGQYA